VCAVRGGSGQETIPTLTGAIIGGDIGLGLLCDLPGVSDVHFDIYRIPFDLPKPI